jgi:hypothetical protein
MVDVAASSVTIRMMVWNDAIDTSPGEEANKY